MMGEGLFSVIVKGSHSKILDLSLIYSMTGVSIVFLVYLAVILISDMQSSKRKEPETKISSMAILSLMFLITGIFCVFATAPLAFVLALLSIYRIHKSKGKLTGLGIAVVALVLAQMGTTWMIYIGIPRIRSISPRMVCGSNMSALGKAMNVYMQNNDGNSPTPSKWCDLLIQQTGIDEKQFQCYANKKQRCSFAINPNCIDWNCSPDTVLLFETTGGWNKYGGKELVDFTSHLGYGCNILYCDLNWGDDQNQ
jgi:hypothetical protein